MLHLALTLLVVVPAQRFELTQEVVDEAIATAQPVVERHLGYGPGEKFQGARLATVDEIVEALVEENVPIFEAQLGQSDAAREQAEAFAKSLAPSMFAKFAFESRTILVSEKGFDLAMHSIPFEFDIFGGDTRPTRRDLALSAILAHELVHAADEAQFGMHAYMKTLGNADRVTAFNALMEGHAQHVARGVCAELDWGWGFDHITGLIANVSAPEKGDDPGLEMVLAMQREQLAMMYREGEAFVRALGEAGGREAIGAAFRAPPVDMAEILRPEWYLDPSKRPRLEYSLDAGLEAFEKPYDGEGSPWAGARQSLNEGAFRQAMAGLPEPIITRCLAGFRAGRLSSRVKGGQEAMHYLLAAEWSSAAEASFAMGAMRSLLELKDEMLKEGSVRVLEAEYTPLGEGLVGVFAAKRLEAFGQELTVHTVIAASGPVSIEMLRSGEPGEREEMVAEARELLAAIAVSRDEEPAPEPDEKGEESGN